MATPEDTAGRSSNDALGDRMKAYEMVEAGRRLDPFQPICARIDGKCFSSFTRGLSKPYDERLSKLMIATTEHLVTETDALAGYTQSDEISLLWLNTNPLGELWLGGRVQKLSSILASTATAFFNSQIPDSLPEKKPGSALFDARVWNVPSRDEAASLFLWRERDAIRNAISQAARSVFPHKQLLGKNGREMREMLEAKGILFSNYPSYFTRGTFIQRRTVMRPYTSAEIERLPAKHHARMNPDLIIERGEVRVLEVPEFDSVTNRVAVLFEGRDPQTAE